jgi:hypothetical protein
MAAVHMTAAQVKKLGDRAKQLGLAEPIATKARREKWPYHTKCVTCLEEFTVVERENDHVKEAGHARYELVIA